MVNIVCSGLSLCIQGTLAVFHENMSKRRIIPVYTGNTDPVMLHRYNNKVYPCVYREHIVIRIDPDKFHGLSLCIQGTQQARSRSKSQDRFIPVYTGNTMDRIMAALRKAVYPCVYREH